VPVSCCTPEIWSIRWGSKWSNTARNFIRPYRDWLVGGDQPKRIAYDQMTFKPAFLSRSRNHDYYDLPLLLGLLSGITGPLQWLLRSLINLDVGCMAPTAGMPSPAPFLDYLKGRPKHSLGDHLDQHYTSRVDDRRCLTYRPGNFTRLPNRYYSFRHAGIDVFALDSNTFNQTLAGQGSGKGGQKRQDWLAERAELHQQKAERLKAIGLELLPSLQNTEPGDRADDLAGEIEAIDEQLLDIEKRLKQRDGADSVDQEQLDWLRDRLVASWRNPAVRGRVLVLHHPPYVTEATKWFQGQTWPYAINSAGCSIRWPRNWRKHSSARAEATPAGSGAERPRPLPGAAAQRRHRPWRRPHSLADLWGQRLTACAVSGPKERTCRSGSKRLTARWRTRSCSSAAVARAAACGAPIRLCGWRSQPAAPPDSRFDRWWPNAAASLGEP